jgi:Predicted membrane protein
MKTNTRKLTIIAMLVALSFAAVTFFRIPIVLFLKYDPKDVIITIGGLIWGPVTSLFVSLIVSIIEMITISDTGIIGLVMNILASCFFACPAAIIYKRRRTLSGASIGLIIGAICATTMMLLWNYLITPLFMNVPRAEVVKLLIPYILPFNLLKNGLNAAFVMLLYKPILNALRKAHLIDNTSEIAKRHWSTIFVSVAIIATGILLTLAWQGII